MKRLSLRLVGTLTALLLCMAPLALKADEYDKKTVVTFSEPVEVPGIILEPGTYVIKLLNSSSNRHIAEILNEDMDHLYALTFTVAAERLDRTDKPVLTFFEETGSRPKTLHKWFWPGDTIGQEFVYPKYQAARISAATKGKVAEGSLPTVAEGGQSLMPDNAKGLSLESAQQSTNAGVAGNERVAQPQITPAPVITETAPQNAREPSVSVVAQATPPPPDPVRAVEPAEEPRTVADASADIPGTLPQTASPLPFIGSIGLISLLLAAALALVRRNRSERI